MCPIFLPGLCRNRSRDFYRCDGIVVHCNSYCDGIPDCEDGLDEMFCKPICPKITNDAASVGGVKTNLLAIVSFVFLVQIG